MCHRRPAVDHIHRLIDRVQRNHLATGDGAVRVVHPANSLPGPPADLRKRTGARTVYNGPRRDSCQPPRARISRLRRHLDAVPNGTAGDRKQHELCWACFRRGYLGRAIGLGD